MVDYVFSPPPVVSLPVEGQAARFPVRRVLCVGRNYAAHAIEAEGISRYGVLLQVRFVKTLVKTSVGKMNKRLMRADPDALCI